MKKRPAIAQTDQHSPRRQSMNWEKATHTMSEEEIEYFKNLNWEWYYNCYLYKNETIEVLCKICQGLNIFQPGEMKKKCVHCGIECRRCEVSEDE